MERPASATTSPAARLDLIGGELCLDFTNTVADHGSAAPREHIDTYADLVAWSEHAGILSDRAAAHLLRQAARHPRDAEMVLQRALALREALYRVVAALSLDRVPQPHAVELLNQNLAQAMCHARLVFAAGTPSGATGHFHWDWEPSGDALDRMLWPVARSAADLLTSDRLLRVRECSGDRCGWLFVDTSKNHSRRWCSMSDCGNRAKVNRFYGRRRARTAA